MRSRMLACTFTECIRPVRNGYVGFDWLLNRQLKSYASTPHTFSSAGLAAALQSSGVPGRPCGDEDSAWRAFASALSRTVALENDAPGVDTLWNKPLAIGKWKMGQ